MKFITPLVLIALTSGCATGAPVAKKSTKAVSWQESELWTQAKAEDHLTILQHCMTYQRLVSQTTNPAAPHQVLRPCLDKADVQLIRLSEELHIKLSALQALKDRAKPTVANSVDTTCAQRDKQLATYDLFRRAWTHVYKARETIKEYLHGSSLKNLREESLRLETLLSLMPPLLNATRL